MATKKTAKPQRRVSSFTDNLQSKNQDIVAKAALQGKKPTKPQKRAPPTVGKSPGKLPAKLSGSKNLTYSKEAEETFDAILEGNFQNVPPLPRSTVRIFLSSTFSDMRAERNALAREAYPKLRDYCTDLGLSFQVVDLRWGLTAEATNSHVTTKICLLELENCQKISLGPSCIAMIGNRYGFCPLPAEIPPDEYNILSQEARSLGLEGASILGKWYIKDDNAVPPVWTLQPITSHLPNYLNEKPGAEKLKEADVKAWAQVELQLIEAIHKAALACADKGLMSKERAHFYIMSVTEHEARNGIVPDKNAFAILRDLQGLDGKLQDELANRHQEIIYHDNGKVEINQETERHLKSLKDYLSSTLGADYVKKYEVPWEAGGVKPDLVNSHKEYMARFCSDFISGVKELIDLDIQASSSLIREREYYSPYAESLHHAHFCEMKCKSFCGQKNTLEKIKSYILDASNRKPYVIFAPSGAGKTSIMAMAMKSLNSWLPDKFSALIRFLGTSPNSTNIYNVLFSICGQLADMTDAILEPQGYKTMKNLQRYLPRFLRSACSTLKMPVIIFFDSIDQLESVNDAYTAKWLPQNLPSNLKVIISTLPKEHDILKNLQTVISEPGNFLEVPLLSDDTSHEIVKNYFTMKNRCISEDQMALLLKTFKKAASPLYLRLLMDEALTWKSYNEVSSLHLPESVKRAINKLFEQLETKFGAKIVQAALGMITVGLNGLSEIELEDAISCVNEALIEIYKYHDPPVPGMIRVPPVLWARIRYDINQYLVERQSQGVTTLFWYHRQFIQVATDRYTQGDKMQNLHKILFEMYASESGIKRDIVLTQRKNLKIENADRYTTPQPTESKNTRKLECMFFHLKNSFKSIDRDFALCASYCNLNFLHAKIVSIGTEKLLAEFQELLKISPCREIKCLAKFVSICKNSLLDISTLAFKIVACIDASPNDVNINNLKTQAKDYILSQTKTMLMPPFACLAKRSGEAENIHDNLSHVFAHCNEFCLLTDKWDDIIHQNACLENTKTITCIDLKSLGVMKYACENINSKPFLSLDAKMIVYLSESEMALVKMLTANGTVTKVPLTDLFSSTVKALANHISRGNCCINCSQDNELLVASIYDRIAVIGSSDFKVVSHFNSKEANNISNLHICHKSTLVMVGKSHKEGIPLTENVIQIWTYSPNVTQKLSFQTDIAIKFESSALTFDECYHVCFGQKEDGSQNWIILTNLKTFMIQNQIEVKEEVLALKMCPSECQGFFLVGGQKLMMMNFSNGQFVNSFEHTKIISAWSVNWDEESLLIYDQDGDVILFNMDMEKLMNRAWTQSTISDITSFQDHLLLIANNKAEIWNVEDFFLSEKCKAGNRGENQKEEHHLKMEEDILSFVITDNGKELITAGNSKKCKVWSLDSFTLSYQFDINVSATKLLMAVGNKIVAFDKLTKQVIIFGYLEKKVVCNDLPDNILGITLTKDQAKLIFVTSGSKPALNVYDIKANSSSRKCTININFKCLESEVLLTPSERYAVFMMKNTEEDFQAIRKMWKAGNFPHQNHPYRFVAVDLSQASGTALYAYHNLSKIPHLGVTMEPYRGNQMLVSTRRWVMYWDIPTGKCDQSLSKVTRKTTLYRPDWLGQQCFGDNDVVCMSESKAFVGVGSQDGYVFIYEADSGMPVGMRAPAVKHPSPVNLLAFSHSSQLLASACTSGLLKLWIPHTAECILSVSLGTELQQLKFAPTELKVVALTKAERSRTIIFEVINDSQ